MKTFTFDSEGRIVQWLDDKNTDNWVDIEDSSCLNPPANYRLKPEPEELWGNKHMDGDKFPHSSETTARQTAVGSGTIYEYIAKHFVEAEK